MNRALRSKIISARATNSDATYRVCLRCGRGVPTSANELFCANDGSKLLECCPNCKALITSPYALYCVHCGTAFSVLAARN